MFNVCIWLRINFKDIDLPTHELKPIFADRAKIIIKATNTMSKMRREFAMRVHVRRCTIPCTRSSISATANEGFHRKFPSFFCELQLAIMSPYMHNEIRLPKSWVETWECSFMAITQIHKQGVLLANKYC